MPSPKRRTRSIASKVKRSPAFPPWLASNPLSPVRPFCCGAGFRKRKGSARERVLPAGEGAVSRMGSQIDARALVLIAFVRDVETGEVHQALRIEPEIVENAQANANGTGGSRDN